MYLYIIFIPLILILYRIDYERTIILCYSNWFYVVTKANFHIDEFFDVDYMFFVGAFRGGAFGLFWVAGDFGGRGGGIWGQTRNFKGKGCVFSSVSVSPLNPDPS